MTLTISFGWWLVPLTVTVVAFVAAYICGASKGPPRGYGDIANGIVNLFVYGAVTVVSLVAWLGWAVLT